MVLQERSVQRIQKTYKIQAESLKTYPDLSSLVEQKTAGGVFWERFTLLPMKFIQLSISIYTVIEHLED